MQGTWIDLRYRKMKSTGTKKDSIKAGSTLLNDRRTLENLGLME